MTNVKATVSDHKSAIVDLAKTIGMQVIYDEGNYVEIADDKQSHEFLRGAGSRDIGVLVAISFNEQGEVKEAHKRVDGITKGDVSGTRGNAGQRLLWTLHLFSRR